MQKHEVKEALDRINEMTDHEVSLNAEHIRKVAQEAYALIGSLESVVYKKKKKR